MTIKNLRIAGIQTSPVTKRERNISQAIELIEDAIKSQAKIICLPELFVTPYFPQYIGIDVYQYSTTIPGPITERFSKIARENQVVLIIPLCEAGSGGYFYNSAVVIDADGTLFQPYHKIHLPQDPLFYEKNYFRPGGEYKIFKTRYADIAVLICYDQWFFEAARSVALMGAEIIFYPTAIGHINSEIPSEGEWIDAWCTIQRAHAIANSVPVISVNRCSTEKDISFFGGSFICDAFGAVLDKAGSKEEVIIADLDMDYGPMLREGWGFFQNSRPDTYQLLLNHPNDSPSLDVKKTPANSGYYMPAEWEHHEAVWIAWPCNEETFPDLKTVQNTFIEIISLLSDGEIVNLLVTDDSVKDFVSSLLIKRDGDQNNIRFFTGYSPDVWIRDYGPTFLVNRGLKKLSAVNWEFNAWGEKYDDLIADGKIAEYILSSLKIPSFKPGIIMEGGSFEVNGRGTLITTRSCLLNPNRNPSLTKLDIEEFLMNYLGVNRIIWLNSGIAGDDTDGHIDDIARFVSPNKVVCALEDNKTDENYNILMDNYEILCNEKDQDGENLQIVTLPMPAKISDGEFRYPASYLNFYIGNKVVLVPVFDDQNDIIALEKIKELFPERKVIGVNARAMVEGFGAIHCATQQEPSL